MRAAMTIAVVLTIAGLASAQVPAPSPDTEAPSDEVAVSAPATDIAAPAAEVAVQSEIAAPEEVEATGPEPSESNVDEDDLPPALQTEVAPSSPPPEFSVEAPLSPWKGYVGVSSGLALHMNSRDEFQQGAVAPAYLHLRVGAVVPGRGVLRHGLQLGVSTNLSREGVYPGGVLSLRQWVIVPSYLLRLGIGPEAERLPLWLATARVGIPIVVSPNATAGAEVAVGAQYFARAGLAVFAEVIYDVVVGGRVRDGSRSTHHLLTIELGLQFELEVLP